jgi:UDP-sulfoquinovose synthase
MEDHNTGCTCWNCPALDPASGPSPAQGRCSRRPELGPFDPGTATFGECPEWQETPFGSVLKDMRVMILGIDGYLGWTLALWLGSLGCKVSGVDNYSRRDWVIERGAGTVVPIARMTDRLHRAQEVLGIRIEFRQADIMEQRSLLHEFIDEVHPEAIVHYGECPSAPYSMIDVEHAVNVQRNNVLGTLGVLFMMRDLVPQASMVKLGTMGEYGTPLTGRPLFEGKFPSDAVLKWDGREWSLGGEMTPRDPASFYHASKVQDTVNIQAACKYWGLRSYDVMQGVIYGVHTPQVAADPALRTRLDMDECFGTVINRFVAQAVVGFPLTMFGTGQQIRGFIALQDAMQCMTRLIAHPPLAGQYEVVNQMSGFYSIRELADAVARVGSKEFGIPVVVQRVENPRVEAEVHPYEPVYNKLPDQFGFAPKVSLEEEVYRMFELLTQPQIKQIMEERKHLILPRTWWSGKKKQVDTLEIMEEITYKPGA